MDVIGGEVPLESASEQVAASQMQYEVESSRLIRCSLTRYFDRSVIFNIRACDYFQSGPNSGNCQVVSGTKCGVKNVKIDESLK